MLQSPCSRRITSKYMFKVPLGTMKVFRDQFLSWSLLVHVLTKGNSKRANASICQKETNRRLYMKRSVNIYQGWKTFISMFPKNRKSAMSARIRCSQNFAKGMNFWPLRLGKAWILTSRLGLL